MIHCTNDVQWLARLTNERFRNNPYDLIHFAVIRLFEMAKYFLPITMLKETISSGAAACEEVSLPKADTQSREDLNQSETRVLSTHNPEAS